MKKILFIGNLLSKSKFTIGPTERVIDFLSDSFVVKSASKHDNKILRLVDMVLKSLITNYDYIHIDIYSTPNSLLYQNITSFIGRLRNRKVILNLHGGGLWDLYIKKPTTIHSLFSRADTIISPSKFLQEMFQNVGYNVMYLPNNIDLSHFPPRGSGKRSYDLLWVRAFQEVYQPWLAVRTLYYVQKSIKNVKLTMVGPDKGSLLEIKSLIEELGLRDNVSIVGKVANTELFELYHSHGVFLNTTKYESFGVAVLEAAACGIPVVSTKVGEIPYLWKDKTDILLIEDSDPEQMAESVISLLNNEALIDYITQNAYAKSRRFDKNIVKLEWVKLFAK